MLKHLKTKVVYELFIAAIFIIGLVLIVPKLISNLTYESSILLYPFQRDDAEGVLLAEAHLIASGINPYQYQPSPAPYFYAGPYTPLYTSMNALGSLMIGPTFKIGRTIQFLATLAVATWIAWGIGWSSPCRISWLIGAWAACLFLSLHLVSYWSVLVRPDMTALLFNLVGLVFLRRWWGPRRDWGLSNDMPFHREEIRCLILGGLCFALGWWTKQTCIAVPLASLLMLLPRHRKHALFIGVLYIILIAIPFFIFCVSTKGGFAQKTIGYQGSWNWLAFLHLVQPFLKQYSWLPIIALPAALLVRLQAHSSFGLLWLLFSAFAALGAGTSGGNHNHFVELLAACCFLVGQALAVGISGLGKPFPTVLNISVFYKTLIILYASYSVILGAYSTVNEHEGSTSLLANAYRYPTPSERRGYSQVASYLANSSGPVYSDNVGILVITGQEVKVTDPFTMATAVRLSRWNDTAIVDDIAAKRYRLIVLRININNNDGNIPSDETRGIIEAIRTNYVIIERNILNIYAPRGCHGFGRAMDSLDGDETQTLPQQCE